MKLVFVCYVIICLVMEIFVGYYRFYIEEVIVGGRCLFSEYKFIVENI